MALVYCRNTAGVVLEAYAATTVRPLSGVWQAELDVDSSAEITGPVTIVVADGALSLEGTVGPSGKFAERARMRVIGGAGGLSRSLPAKGYARCPLRAPISDVLASAGEKLATSSDQAVLDTLLPRWSRLEGPASQALEMLVARAPGALWRVTASGAVWVGVNAWPTIQLDHVVTDDDPARKVMEIAADDPTLTAGVVLDGRQVRHVVHRYEQGSVRSEVWYS